MYHKLPGENVNTFLEIRSDVLSPYLSIALKAVKHQSRKERESGTYMLENPFQTIFLMYIEENLVPSLTEWVNLLGIKLVVFSNVSEATLK